MSDYRIMLTEKAKNDIIDIGDYISYDLFSPDISYQFIKNLRLSISKLKEFPYKYPLVQDEELQKRNIRFMPYKNFYVFYEVIEYIHTVNVLRVGYKKRNWKKIL